MNGQQITVRDAIHAGIRCGLTQSKALEVWRELGGEIRDIEFARLWREEWEAFRQWRKQQSAS